MKINFNYLEKGRSNKLLQYSALVIRLTEITFESFLYAYLYTHVSKRCNKLANNIIGKYIARDGLSTRFHGLDSLLAFALITRHRQQ